MSSGRRNARNLAINWLSLGLTGLVLFLLSPFVVSSLGPVEYGIWSLLNVLTGYMGILDLGVRASTGRHIFLYIGREDYQAVDETIRTSLGFYSILGFWILLVSGLLGWLFPHVFSSVPNEYRSTLIWLVPLMAVNVWTSAVAAVFSSVLVAHERFDLARGVEVATLAIRTFGTIVALSLDYGILGLASVVVASNLLPLFGNFWLGRRVYAPLSSWPLLLNRTRLRELASYGTAAVISSIAVNVIGQTDLMIVGWAIDMSAVTVYSVGAMMVYYSYNLTAQIARTFQPSLQKAVARNEMGSVRWNFFRQVRLSSLVGIPIYVGFILYAEPFIQLWMLGPSFDEMSVRDAATVMKILAGAKLLHLFYVGFGSLLWATGHVRFNASIAVAEALVNLGLSLIFVIHLDWGLAGVAWGTLLSRVIVTTFALPCYACRVARISFWRYMLDIGGRGAIAAVLFSGWCMASQLIMPCHTWISFVLSVVLSLVGFVPIAAIILVPEADLARLRSQICELTTHR